MKIYPRKIIISGVLAIALYSVGLVIYHAIRTSPCDYHPLNDSGKRCLNLFQDSVKKDLVCFHSFGNKNGADCAYKYLDKYRYMVWELGEFKNVDLKKIHISKSKSIGEIDAVTLRGFEIGESPVLSIKDIVCFSVGEEINLIIGDGGNIKTDTISDKCYIASGELNDMSITNHKGEKQFLLNFELFPTFCSLVFLKKNNTFYMIMLNSFENKTIPTKALECLKLWEL